MTERGTKGECCECGKEFDCKELEEHEGILFCADCAQEELEECGFCGSWRFPENLIEYKNPKRKSNWDDKRMCIGCIDDAEDDDCYEDIKED